MSALDVRRHHDVQILPDPRRVILRPFLPGTDALHDGSLRIDVVIERLLAMSDDDVIDTLRSTEKIFAGRHDPAVVERAIEENFGHASSRLPDADRLTAERRRLIGMYFTHEYSVEAAALGNPSIVEAPDQSGLDPGDVRFVLSLRAVGEGHLSSIEFRTGVIDDHHSVRVDPVTSRTATGRRSSATYDRAFFRRRLRDLDMLEEFAIDVLGRLDSSFERSELDSAMQDTSVEFGETDDVLDVARSMTWLAASNYLVEFDPSTAMSARVIHPSGPSETQGMEDARLVRFVDDSRGVGGKEGDETVDDVTYYATYTAFDGRRILPQLLETTDFTTFRVATMSGDCANNKGIAIFPRRIGGRFCALGRHDNVNNFVMTSDDIRDWRTTELIQEPSRPWELMQLGNCGSPIETDAGWLVITHGVGPMRRYSIGALLLQIDDPTRVIGHLREPLLAPVEGEREGYVPNVVYSCGAMVHRDRLVLPYGFADTGASVASVSLDRLLDRLVG